MKSTYQTFAGGTSPPKSKTRTPEQQLVIAFLADHETDLKKIIRRISGKTFLAEAAMTRAETWQAVYIAMLRQAEVFATTPEHKQLAFAKQVTKQAAYRIIRPPKEYSNANPQKLEGDIRIQSLSDVQHDKVTEPKQTALGKKLSEMFREDGADYKTDEPRQTPRSLLGAYKNETPLELTDNVDDVDNGDSDDEYGGHSSTCLRRVDWILANEVEDRAIDRIDLARARGTQAPASESVCVGGHQHVEPRPGEETEFERAERLLSPEELTWYWEIKTQQEILPERHADRRSLTNAERKRLERIRARLNSV